MQIIRRREAREHHSCKHHGHAAVEPSFGGQASRPLNASFSKRRHGRFPLSRAFLRRAAQAPIALATGTLVERRDNGLADREDG